jgi:hypothetical protein
MSLVREIRISQMHKKGDGLGWWPMEAAGSLGNRNDHAVMAVLVPLCLSIAQSRWSWALIALAGLAGFYDSIVAKSRQTMLGLGIGLASLVAFRTSVRWRVRGGIATAFLVAVALISVPSVRERFMDMARAPLSGRSMPMAYGVALYLEHPLLGVGPSLFGHYWAQGVRDGWTFQGTPLPAFGMPWVHCLPIEMACETGTAGLVVYGFVLWSFLARLRQACSANGPSRDLGKAVAASAIAMAAISLVDLTFIKDWVRICWWLVLGLGFAAPTLLDADKSKRGRDALDQT